MIKQQITKHNRFQRGSGVYTCRSCGKKTRDTGHDEAGVELCRDCLYEADLENEHLDGNHDDEPNEDCSDCKAER